MNFRPRRKWRGLCFGSFRGTSRLQVGHAPQQVLVVALDCARPMWRRLLTAHHGGRGRCVGSFPTRWCGHSLKMIPENHNPAPSWASTRTFCDRVGSITNDGVVLRSPAAGPAGASAPAIYPAMSRPLRAVACVFVGITTAGSAALRFRGSQTNVDAFAGFSKVGRAPWSRSLGGMPPRALLCNGSPPRSAWLS